jgi:D-ribulokinase
MASQRGDRVCVGIDVGTSGVRAVAVREDGSVAAEAQRPLGAVRPVDGIHEQDPETWWKAVCEATRSLAVTEVAGVAVTSTSGSLVVTDASGRPLRPAMLYDDSRGEPGAAELNASFSLAKAMWVRRHEARTFDRARHLLHPADWLTGRLTGVWGVSDFSNCLKLGYDPQARAWGGAVVASNLGAELFPRVLCPGERVGSLTATGTGLPAGAAVVAGATDGMAGLIASGACEEGDANTTLGTTMVWKALAVRRPAEGGGIYSHLHPSGLWAPGAASNTGPGSLRADDPPLDARQMEALAGPHFPVRLVCYLLSGVGERFPFARRDAATFVEGRPRERGEWCAAQLQSLALVERWGYERLAEAGVGIGDTVYSTGGAAGSRLLAQLRADVMGRTVVRMEQATAAFGAALLAWSGGDICAAIRSMTKRAETVTPRPEMAAAYAEIYGLFRDACRQRGYGA